MADSDYLWLSKSILYTSFITSKCVCFDAHGPGRLGVEIFFLIQFYVPFKLFHSYRDESIGRWGENRSTRGKTT